MSSINTNVSAMTALQTLTETSKSLTEVQKRISTGFRVGEASDNAAYWSIATTMRSDNAALSTVQDALGLGAATVEVAYTAAFVAVTSTTYQDQITAGVLIYRGFTYLMPIIIGAFCYLAWRFDKGRGVPVTHGPLDAPLAPA